MDHRRLHRMCGAFALGVAVLIGVAGCSVGGTARRQPAGQTGTAPPAALGTLQADATAIIDSATARDWGQVSAQLSAIQSAWSTLRPDLASRGARTGLLDSTDRAISVLDHQSNLLSARGTALAANHLTAFVPDMLALYTSPVPPQLAEMVYLTRAIQFDADAGHRTAVWEDARTLGTQWAYIRAVAQRVDPGDASRLDLQLAALDAAVADQAGSSSAAIPAMTVNAPLRSSSSASVTASSAAAGLGAAPSASSSASAASGSIAGASSVARTSRSGSGTPSLPTAQRRTGTMAGSGPASSPHVSDPLQTAAQAILTTLTALQQAFLATGRA